MNSHLKTIVIWLVVIAAVVIGYQIFSTASSGRQQMDQTAFYEALDDGDIQEVNITGDTFGMEINGKFTKPRTGPAARPIKEFSTYIVKDEKLTQKLREANVIVKVKSRAKLTSSQGKKVTFRDVAGVEEAKEELRRSSSSSRSPSASRSSAARSPRACC